MTSPVELKFWRQVTPTPGAVDLRFGDAPAVDEVVGALSASLPAVTLPALSISAVGDAREVSVGTLAAALPPAELSPLVFEAEEYVERVLGEVIAALVAPALPAVALVSAAIDYDQALPDAIGPGISAPYRYGADDHAPLAAAQQTMRPSRTPLGERTQQTLPILIGLAARQQQMIVASRASVQRWQHGAPLGNGAIVMHSEMARQRRASAHRWQHGIPAGIGTRFAHQERIRFRHRLRTDQQHAENVVSRATIGHQTGLPLAKGLSVRYQQMIPLPLGWWQIAYPWPEPPFDPNAPSSPVNLRFCRLSDGTTALIFGCPPHQSGIVVPVQRSYIVLNNITLVRLSDGTPLSAFALNLQIDADSWTWGWDASIPGAELALVEPLAGGEPVELLATINGQPFRLLAERLARDRSFAQSRIRVSGRGRAAMLADPHSPVVTRGNTIDRTMQQLLDDALTTNGVSIGWAIDWQAADWLVPAGLYNHTGPYIAHAQRIAEAAGAYIQAHPVDATLRILPRYPLMPWEWAAAPADITLPSAPVVRESVEWLQRPDYNRVFVSGAEVGGILGQVTRAGTAGDVVAPMITDPLCTHADAARARGGAVLADTGRQARIALDLPILPETGIIVPGRLVRYTDAGTTRTGLVRSTAVRAQLPAARQTIELETHT